MRRSGGNLALLAVLIATLGLAPHRPPAAAPLTVVRDGTARTVPLSNARGHAAAAAPELAEALGYVWQGGAIRMGDEVARFWEGSPFFVVGGAVFQLPNPVYRADGQLMIPITWALNWLPRQRSASWRYMDGRLVARRAMAVGPRSRRGWLVVIDAGHGGEDPGAIGTRGTREKDVTLAIAKKLARRLEGEKQVRVVLTRDRDTLIALADRPRIPQLRGIEGPPDLFLSIHGNAMPRKPNSIRGFETYFLAVAKTEQARRVALRENASLKFEGETRLERLDPLQYMLSDLRSTGNLRESSLLAGSVSRSLGMTLDAADLGVKQAGFWVLVGATMPAALVEVGYLSNPAEERLLRSSSYQAKIADALADGIMNYLAEYGRRVWSSHEAGG